MCFKCLSAGFAPIAIRAIEELVPRGLLSRLNGKKAVANYENAAPDALKPTILAIAKLEHAARQPSNSN